MKERRLHFRLPKKLLVFLIIVAVVAVVIVSAKIIGDKTVRNIGMICAAVNVCKASAVALAYGLNTDYVVEIDYTKLAV